MSLRPLIAICGTTGVGKSKLAVELALKLLQRGGASSAPRPRSPWRGARIINADAMQVYKGMDVITNKIPEAEMQGVEHLLMGFKNPGEQYVVGEWVRDAMRAIDETHARNAIPIVVGGTSYWMQHLIFPNRLSSTDAPASTSASPPSQSEDLSNSVSSLPPPLRQLFDALPSTPPSAHTDPEAALELHSLLSFLDPPVGARWHWRDTRKALRSLEIIKNSGRRASDMIDEQSLVAPKPRYRTLWFWIHADPDSLNPRLDARVDDMIKQGLLEEIHQMKEPTTFPIAADTPTAADAEPDYTLGIYQSIGFKEFRSYLASNSTSHDEKAFDEAVHEMKLATRKYAKRQVSWIRNKLLPAAYAANAAASETTDPETDVVGRRDAVPFFLLNATELGDKWGSNVQSVAERITEDFLEDRPLPDPRSLSAAARTMLTIPEKATDPAAVLNARRKVTCPVCTVDPARPVMIEEGAQWATHQKAKSHRYLKAKQERETDEGRRRFEAEIEEKRRLRRQLREGIDVRSQGD